MIRLSFARVGADVTQGMHGEILGRRAGPVTNQRMQIMNPKTLVEPQRHREEAKCYGVAGTQALSE